MAIARPIRERGHSTGKTLKAQVLVDGTARPREANGV